MNLLEGSIAFALALAGFATLCTVFVEVFHRFASMRSRGLRLMLAAYFDGVVKKELPDQGQAARLGREFLDTLTENALQRHLGRNFNIAQLWRTRLLALDELTPKDFLARLPDTEAYKAIAAAGKTPPVVLVKTLAEQYDRYCEATTRYFKARSHALSLGAGVFLAFFANIHAGWIFDAFVKNPDLAQRMQAQAGEIRTALQEAERRQSEAAKTAAPNPAPAAAPAPGEAAKPDVKPVEGSKVNTDKEIAKVKSTLDEYQKLGLPIGWARYPNCFAEGKEDPRCEGARGSAKNMDGTSLPQSILTTVCNDFWSFCHWALVVFLTGLLIGLGGPFWYDLAVKLSTLRALVNGKAALPEATPQTAAGLARSQR